MEKVKEVYKGWCSKFEVVPCQPFIRALEKCSPPLTNLEIKGNSKELFNHRLKCDDVRAIVETIVATDPDLVALVDVKLCCNSVSDDGASHVARLLEDDPSGAYRCQIQSLDLSTNDIGPQGCQSICQYLMGAKSTLTSLNLNGNPLKTEGGMLVAEMLNKNDDLTHLDIGNVEMGTESIIALMTVLQSNRSLTHLNIENPRILKQLQEESTGHIARMLRVNETLQSLNIAKHQIRDLGARILSQNLLENKNLRSLNLRCNGIGIGGGEALAALLMRESALERINLACNKISEDGARAFGMALQINNVLQSLNLSNNDINDRGMAALANSMRTNSTCQEFLLWGNEFGFESSKIFQELFEGRFRYFDWATDFKPYVVDGHVHICHQHTE